MAGELLARFLPGRENANTKQASGLGSPEYYSGIQDYHLQTRLIEFSQSEAFQRSVTGLDFHNSLTLFRGYMRREEGDGVEDLKKVIDLSEECGLVSFSRNPNEDVPDSVQGEDLRFLDRLNLVILAAVFSDQGYLDEIVRSEDLSAVIFDLKAKFANHGLREFFDNFGVDRRHRKNGIRTCLPVASSTI